MTCIVGIVHANRVLIGGDSAGVSGLDLRIRRDEKVFTNGEFVFGCTTSFRMIQLLRYKLTPPKRHPDTDVMAFMATTFVDAVRYTLKDGGFAGRVNEVESGGTFLVGYANRLFTVASDYQVGESAEDFDACGCGDMYALGSLMTSKGSGQTAMQRLSLALDCAAHFSGGVIGPYVFKEGGSSNPAPGEIIVMQGGPT